MTLQAVYKVVPLEHNARILFQIVFVVIREVHEAQKMETSASAVGGDSFTHVVDIAVQLRYEDVDVLAAIILCAINKD